MKTIHQSQCSLGARDRTLSSTGRFVGGVKADRDRNRQRTQEARP